MVNFSENISHNTNTVLILGYFDGIHLGHREVIISAVEYSKMHNANAVLLTFNSSPAEFFGYNIKSIYSREYNYELIQKFGVDKVISQDFPSIANISAKEYLNNITGTYKPIAIFTGFNYTFGSNRTGNSEFLESNQIKYGYEYFSVPPKKYKDEIISSTGIKKCLTDGDIEKANIMLGEDFSITSKVIQGRQIGRTIGFPTANMNYPENITKIPYGVYKAKVGDKPAILNWGVKPTIDGNNELIEVHIPNFEGDLYGNKLKVSFIKKIRNEKKFNNLDELKLQIKRDTEECLK